MVAQARKSAMAKQSVTGGTARFRGACPAAPVPLHPSLETIASAQITNHDIS